jgi:hypothetical protein
VGVEQVDLLGLEPPRPVEGEMAERGDDVPLDVHPVGPQRQRGDLADGDGVQPVPQPLRHSQGPALGQAGLLPLLQRLADLAGDLAVAVAAVLLAFAFAVQAAAELDRAAPGAVGGL